MLESVWLFTTVERGNFTPNWLRTILFVYDFWHFPGRALNVHCTLRPPPSPKRKSHQQLARISAALWGFTTYFMVKFTPLYFTQWTSGKRKTPHKNCRKTHQSTHNHKKRFYILFSVILLHVTQKKRFKVMNLQKIKEPILTNFKDSKFL